MKLGVENMLEVYMQDKKRTKDLETQLDTYNTAIGDTVQRIESIRTNAGMHTCSNAHSTTVSRINDTHSYVTF